MGIVNSDLLERPGASGTVISTDPIERAFQATLSGARKVNLRLLRVFAEIVHIKGFSAAQVELGMPQATISAHVKHAADRLACACVSGVAAGST